MKHQCDKCDRPATHHLVEIVKGQKIEKHLCDVHAAEDGLAIKEVHAPIGELLTNFVKMHGGQAAKPESNELTCECCGTSFSEFRESSLLGCSDCYKAFEAPLSPLLERAHEGATHHVGKVPRRAGASDARQVQLQRIRKRLDEAIGVEDYELAARLRDDITRLEEGPTG